jgi:hypothetical protein
VWGFVKKSVPWTGKDNGELLADPRFFKRGLYSALSLNFLNLFSSKKDLYTVSPVAGVRKIPGSNRGNHETRFLVGAVRRLFM